MSDYDNGYEDATRRIRDNVICTMIGFQNEMGHQDQENPEYKAYQRVIKLMEKEYGPLMGPVKKQ